MFIVGQIGMNSNDLAGSLRLYTEAFGFANSGGQCLWGPVLRTQGLDQDSHALMWWMVGRQQLVQLEFFHHTRPMQRPLRADWRPCDHGWVRFGIAVPDFAATLAVLARHGIPLLGATMVVNGLRRAAFRDPYVGCVVEVMEDGPALTGNFAKTSGTGPALVYAAASVSDIDAARVYYEKVLSLPIAPQENLHAPEHEALWGLSGAERSGFLVRGGDVSLEIVQYRNPVGRPKPADYRCSDQGINNAMIFTRDLAEAETAIAQAQAAGYAMPHVVHQEKLVATYIVDPERELEISCFPAENDAPFGFVATTPFFGCMS